ncbi:uncharacterized protein [Littorina saxatilis]|uniref:uncharacterized protein n=1 Tax=Littorina saxatilis TaxID=31220 RepID=UPI0038B45E9F
MFIIQTSFSGNVLPAERDVTPGDFIRVKLTAGKESIYVAQVTRVSEDGPWGKYLKKVARFKDGWTWPGDQVPEFFIQRTEILGVLRDYTTEVSKRALVSRPPPPAPDLVAYYNLEEIRQDTLQLAAPWCLLENSKEQIQVGITKASQVKLRVVILPDFTVQVHVYGFHASSALSTIEHVRLNQFLLDLHERELCPGITEAGLQRYADLPSGDNHVYFKHVLGYCLDNSGVSCVSCVRSGTFVNCIE